MPLTRRCTPEHPSGESCVFAIDYSFILPPGVGIDHGDVLIYTNTASPVLSSDWTIGPVQVAGRVLYSTLSGGIEATDYQIRWIATDTEGFIWPRTMLVLCAATS